MNKQVVPFKESPFEHPEVGSMLVLGLELRGRVPKEVRMIRCSVGSRLGQLLFSLLLSVPLMAGAGGLLDVDDSGHEDALTDGLLIIRYLFGFTDESLTIGAAADEARRDTEAITTHLSHIRERLDIDDNGESDALTDGVLIIRHLFGFTDEALIIGAVGPDARNDTPEAVEAALLALKSGPLPDLINYSFSASETKTLPGTSTENNAGSGSCTGIIKAEDQIGRLALAALFFDNYCYTNGSYNHNNYEVKRGAVIDSGNTLRIDAYQIYEPTDKADHFLASQHAVYYRFPTQEDYTVYRFEGDQFAKVLEMPASQIDTTRFIQLTNNGVTLTVSQLTGSATYVFAPSNQRVSRLTELATGVEGARLASTALGDVLTYRYTVNGTPFDTKLDFNQGPDTHSNVYSRTRQFFLVQNSIGDPGIVWQDKDDQSIHLTWLGMDYKSPSTMGLPNSRSEDLAAAVHDANGTLYYLTIQSGSGVGSTETARIATLYKVDDNGRQLQQSVLNTSKSGLNMVRFGDQNIASLQYMNGELGLILGRQMHRSNDGLNHQGAIAVVFDANSLNVDKHWGQTSSHSFESVLTTNSSGKFLGIDLGDNYPRGVHLHAFNATQRDSRVVYTFKTQHSRSAQSPAGATYPEYTEISGNGTTYYKWSNDNRTYTELGGVIEGSQGYTVIFASESSPTDKALDNRRVGDNLNDPRNIGLIQVIKDFEHASGSGNVLSDDLVLTSGLAETGGFYTFGGHWAEQRNTGVVWLTDYQVKARENVSRLKAIRLGDGNILLLWEKWTPDQYMNSYAMKVSETGQKLVGPVELGRQARFNRRDDVWVLGNHVYWIAGNKTERKLELFVLDTGTLDLASGYTEPGHL